MLRCPLLLVGLAVLLLLHGLPFPVLLALVSPAGVELLHSKGMFNLT